MITEWLQQITFVYPWLLYFLPAIPLAVWLVARSKKKKPAMLFSTLAIHPRLDTVKVRLLQVPVLLRSLVFMLLLVALARPQRLAIKEKVTGKGIDIILCMDISGSMLAEDFTPNRLEAAKQVAIDFVNGRKVDRIGLVIFAGESFTQCPLTTDYALLTTQIKALRSGLLLDGTAIGSGLATSVDRLRSSNAASKVIILLTDGENNGGIIPPITAREIAKAFGIRVYTIGVGTEGFAMLPQQTAGGIVRRPEKVNIDEALLQSIAEETGGKYFRAVDNTSLAAIYAAIDRLEKSDFEITILRRYQEQFHYPLIAAIFLLVLELFMRYTVLRVFP